MTRFLMAILVAFFVVLPTASNASLESCINDYCWKYDARPCIAKQLKMYCGSTDVNNCTPTQRERAEEWIGKCIAVENKCVNWCQEQVDKGKQ